MNVVKEIERITALELQHGIIGGSTGSWHHKYKNSAWVYVGGLPYELTEGDIICVMSQLGEVEDINLVRDKATNKSMGFAFIKYEDQRSTILAVDNFNGMSLLGRTVRVDHVDKYKLPKEVLKKEEEELERNPNAEVSIGPGHAYQTKDLVNDYNITSGIDLWSTGASKRMDERDNHISEERRSKKEKKEKKEKKGKRSSAHHGESNDERVGRKRRYEDTRYNEMQPGDDQTPHQDGGADRTSNNSVPQGSTAPPGIFIAIQQFDVCTG
jgi:RNA-binding motif X-linked protein 2